MKYVIDIDAFKACLDLLPTSCQDIGCVELSDVKKLIDSFPKEELKSTPMKMAHWIYWDGWIGNHDMRIEDAVCSECGYKHPTVRWERRDPRGEAAYEAVLNKLKDECPSCKAIMSKE